MCGEDVTTRSRRRVVLGAIEVSQVKVLAAAEPAVGGFLPSCALRVRQLCLKAGLKKAVPDATVVVRWGDRVTAAEAPGPAHGGSVIIALGPFGVAPGLGDVACC